MMAKIFSIRLSDEQHKALIDRAETEGVNKGFVVKKALDLYLSVSAEDLREARTAAEKAYNARLVRALE